MRRVGVVLVLAGVGLLGYLAWQFWGSTWVGHRTQAQVTSELQAAWEGDRPVLESDHGRAVALLRVPRFGEEYVVPILDGVEDDALAAGVGHFSGSQGPGEVGNYALAGHRITHGAPFADLPELEVGDEVVVETQDATYTYVVDTGGEELEVPFTDGWVLDPAPVNPDGGVGPAPGQDRLITLTTCAELFHTDQRSIVFGHLVETTPR